MDYNRMAATCLNLLSIYGRSMTLRQETPASMEFDPATGFASPGVNQRTGKERVSYADQTVLGIVQAPQLSKRAESSIGDTFKLETEIAVEDKFLLIAAQGVDPPPKPGDLLKVGDRWMNVITIIPVSPAGVDLAYRVLVRD